MNEPQYGPPTGPPIVLAAGSDKKRKAWPWLVGVFVAAVLLLGTCGFLSFQLLNTPVGVGTAFATAVQNEQYADAYDLLCDSSMSEISFEEFTTDYVPSQTVEQIEPASFSLRPDGETDEFVVRYSLVDGDSELVEYPMVRENGDWRICSPPKLSE